MQRVGFLVKFGLVASLVLALLPPAGLTAQQARILAVVLVTVGFWASCLVLNYFASLILFAVVLMFGLASARRRCG